MVIARAQATTTPASSIPTLPNQSRPFSASSPNESFGPQSDLPIDPVLLRVRSEQQPLRSGHSSGCYPPSPLTRHNESEDESENSEESKSGSSDEDEGDMLDVGWAATGQAREAHPGKSLFAHECPLMLLQVFARILHGRVLRLVTARFHPIMSSNTRVTRTRKWL